VQVAIVSPFARSCAALGGRHIKARSRSAPPLGLALTPEGNLLATNAPTGEIVEVTPEGAVPALRQRHRRRRAVRARAAARHDGVLYVDDNANTLKVLR
jgi:hypothetical protein